MLELLQSSFPFRASLAAILALVTAAVVFGSVYGMIRLATPRGRLTSRPDPIQGPQEALDGHAERDVR